MGQLIDIRKVEIGPQNLTARIRIADGGPLMTDEDLMGTTMVYRLMPEICDHACLGDAGPTFKDALPKTEVAHLLEHVTIELMARTDLAGDISCGRTWAVADEDRTYDVQVACPDDVLCTLALSSAAWILQWAYSGGGEPEPDVDAMVGAIVAKVEQVSEEEAAKPAEKTVDEPEIPAEEADGDAPESDTEPAGSVDSEPSDSDSEPTDPEPVHEADVEPFDPGATRGMSVIDGGRDDEPHHPEGE
ncbi:MAG: hypothetical protein LKK57_05220 [Atopobiaceae bacterium]|nr:hypothetical protein [Atopobiaceae bacterium]MCI2207740.1 hypothetical protein [Atopobiaceae bacterium]